MKKNVKRYQKKISKPCKPSRYCPFKWLWKNLVFFVSLFRFLFVVIYMLFLANLLGYPDFQFKTYFFLIYLVFLLKNYTLCSIIYAVSGKFIRVSWFAVWNIFFFINIFSFSFKNDMLCWNNTIFCHLRCLTVCYL